MATSTDRELQKNGRAIISAAYDWAMQQQGWTPGGGHYSMGGYELSKPDELGNGSVMTAAGGTVIKHGADQWKTRVFLPISRAVRGAFQPWFGLPDPERLTPVVKRMSRASYELCAQAQTKDGVIVGANLDMSILQTIADNVGEFHGAAMVAYKEKYVDKLDTVVSAQSAAAALLAAGAQGQKRILQTARTDVLNIARACADAMRERGGGSLDLDIVKAIGGAAALLVTGGAAAPVIAAANYAVTTYGNFRPAPTKAAPSQFDGKNVDAVLDQLVEALTRLKKAVAGREQILDDHLRHVADQLGRFDLKTSGKLLDTTSTERIGVQSMQDHPADRFEVRTDLTFLEHVGHDQMPQLARLLERTADTLAGDVSSDPWRRNSRVGMGEVGAHGGWILLNRRLRELVHETAVEVDRGGDHLVIVAKLLGDTEREVERELAQHARAVSSHD